MKYSLLGVALVAAIAIFLLFPKTVKEQEKVTVVEAPVSQLNSEVRAFLEVKKSPLAPHTDLLLEQKHWRLLIAISAIESQYCTRQLGYNCWGIGGDAAYKKYASLPDAILDAENLITKWQAKGRWLTVEDMNCSYVVPCSPNWVRVVNKTLTELEKYQ